MLVNRENYIPNSLYEYINKRDGQPKLSVSLLFIPTTLIPQKEL